MSVTSLAAAGVAPKYPAMSVKTTTSATRPLPRPPPNPRNRLRWNMNPPRSVSGFESGSPHTTTTTPSFDATETWLAECDPPSLERVKKGANRWILGANGQNTRLHPVAGSPCWAWVTRTSNTPLRHEGPHHQTGETRTRPVPANGRRPPLIAGTTWTLDRPASK